MSFTLPILNELLLVWEDFNKITEFDHLVGQVTKIFGLSDEEKKKMNEFESMPGSEISKNFQFGKPIPKYQNLASLLESRNDSIGEIDHESFLPSIPDVFKNDYKTKLQFCNEKLVSLLVSPYYLLKWAQHKKVCVVKNRKLLEGFAQKSDTFGFTNLPYECFLLKFDEPFVFDKKYEGEQILRTIAHIIVYQTEQEVHIFGIPDELKERSLDDDEVKIFEKVIQHINNLNLNQLRHEARAFVASKSAQSPQLMKKVKHAAKKFTVVNDMIAKVPGDVAQRIIQSHMMPFHVIVDKNTGGNHCYTPSEYGLDCDSDELPLASMVGDMLMMLNGLGQALLSTPGDISAVEMVNHSTEGDVSETHPEAFELSSDNQEILDWYEVPEHSVDFFKAYRHKGTIKMRTTRGSEKSPHVRRSHLRRKFDVHGNVVSTTLVKSSIIHKDRLAKGIQVKSGILTT